MNPNKLVTGEDSFLFFFAELPASEVGGWGSLSQKILEFLCKHKRMTGRKDPFHLVDGNLQ